MPSDWPGLFRAKGWASAKPLGAFILLSVDSHNNFRFGPCRRMRAWQWAAPVWLLAATLAAGAQSDSATATSAQPIVITLDEAIQRAQTSDPAFAAAQAASKGAALDRSIAAAGLLPSARLYSSDIYTQPNGIYSQGDAGSLQRLCPSSSPMTPGPGSTWLRVWRTKT